MLPIFFIIAVSTVLFIGLALMMKKVEPDAAASGRKRVACAICREESPESEMVTRPVGDAGQRRYFCDRCVIELYEESRLLHDPRSPESDSADS